MTAPGIVLESTATVSARAAVTTESIPPGREPTTRASPPPAGSSHRWRGVSSLPSSASGSGRAETKSTSPPGVNAGAPSPFALRVSRRAGASPVGSTSHSAVTNAVRLGLSVATVVTRRVPSGDSASPPTRGSAT